ncbi:hypothetical protein GCM10028801_31280 [Nocardioides maradonensis]
MTTQVEDVSMEAIAPEAPELRVADRCDSCGAQAFVVVGQVIGGDPLSLYLCSHHTHQHFDALTLDGWQILVDNRDTINRKPGGSV